MFKRILDVLKATAVSLLLVVTTTIGFSSMMPFALLKLVLPFRIVRRLFDPIIAGIGHWWNSCNFWWMAAVGHTRWDVQGADGFKKRGWYLVSCNHQSWVDILVLQKVFSGRIPFLKFFIKYELIFVPLVGLAWWALDFPFMKRKGGSSAQKDLETARQACEKFRVIPTSVISFAEGTRFTQAKHDQQRSPFRHLLKPKAGGIGMALATMGDMFDAVVDVTVIYPKGVPTFTDLMTGHIPEIVVRVHEVKIPEHLLPKDGSAAERGAVQEWLNVLWARKDVEIDALNAEFKKQA